MQTIETKYLGPTDHKGSRIKATHSGNYTTIVMRWDGDLNSEGNHILAANLLAEKLNWEGDYIGGHTQDGMVFVDSRPKYSFHTKSREAA